MNLSFIHLAPAGSVWLFYLWIFGQLFWSNLWEACFLSTAVVKWSRLTLRGEYWKPNRRWCRPSCTVDNMICKLWEHISVIVTAAALFVKHVFVPLQGFVPFFVSATAGTTVYGAFDPLIAISDICKKYSIWMHVDVSNTSFLWGTWGLQALICTNSPNLNHRHCLKHLRMCSEGVRNA